MVITSRVSSEFFERSQEQRQERLIRIAPHQGRVRSPVPPPPGSGPAWTNEEHERFLEAMELFPSGPWKVIANYVGSKTPRQAMTHAQKYRQKIARRKRGLKTSGKQLVDVDNVDKCAPSPSSASPPSPASAAALPAAPLVVDATQDPLSIDVHGAPQFVPILPWSNFTTPQVVMQEHWDFLHDSPPDSPLFESEADLAAFLLEDYEPLLFADDFDASLEDEQEISRILAECGW